MPGSVKGCPFFSIVIPVYNVEPFLEECLQSILNQTFSDYEVILVDDGSKDGSGMLCDRYAASDPRFQAYHKQNEGQLASRIYGMERASGLYILSPDSDDMLRMDALETLKSVADWSDADLLLFNGSRKRDFSVPWIKSELVPGILLEKESLYELICTGTNLNNMALKCFKCKHAGNWERLKKYTYVKKGEDLLQSLEIISRAEKAVYIDENLYFYRQNGGSISSIFREDSYRSTVTVGGILRSYAADWDEGESKWLPLIYDRNLKMCADAVKEIMGNCNEKQKRREMLREVMDSDFFNSSRQYGRLKNLQIWDRILILSVRSDNRFMTEILTALIRRIMKKRRISAEENGKAMAE